MFSCALCHWNVIDRYKCICISFAELNLKNWSNIDRQWPRQTKTSSRDMSSQFVGAWFEINVYKNIWIKTKQIIFGWKTNQWQICERRVHTGCWRFPNLKLKLCKHSSKYIYHDQKVCKHLPWSKSMKTFTVIKI